MVIYEATMNYTWKYEGVPKIQKFKTQKNAKELKYKTTKKDTKMWRGVDHMRPP